VSGKVSYKGAPVKGGNITFVSSEGKASASTSINEDGTYTISKVPAGAVQICVETETLNPAKRSKTPKYSPPPGMKAPEGLGSGNTEDLSKRYVWIPPAYANPETTKLAYTVKGGSQEHNLDLD